MYRFLLMIFICFLRLPAALAYGFRPPSFAEELGCSPTLTFLRNVFTRANLDNYDRSKRKGSGVYNPFYFDPLNLATDLNFGRFREAELKHGRIAMLAVVETILIPVLKRSPISGHFAEQVPESSIPPGLLNRAGAAVVGATSGGSNNEIGITAVIAVVATCGLLETLFLVPESPQDMPGDYQLGYWGVRNKGIHERELVVELENGRLAMMAFAGQVAAEIATGGKTWDEQWLDLYQTWLQSALP